MSSSTNNINTNYLDANTATFYTSNTNIIQSKQIFTDSINVLNNINV